MLAGVKLGEEVDEVSHLLLLGAGGAVGVVGCHGVQEGPGVSAQLLAVQGTIWGWLLLLHHNLLWEKIPGSQNGRGWIGPLKIM